jgi:hypothetical protein
MQFRRIAAATVAGVAITSLVGVGSATARALITGDDIKNGSITGADVANGSLHLVDLDRHGVATLRGQKGDTGPQGVQGVKGEKGEKGDTGARGATGAKGDTGPEGPAGAAAEAGAPGVAGPAGPQGAPGRDGANGKDAPLPQYGVATVNVKRGSGTADAWATYSTPLGSPVGDTASGSFRFTCDPTKGHVPCTVSVRAAALGTGSGTVKVYPRVLIMRQDFNAGGPSSFCEYGDGGLATITKQASSATPTYSPMQVHIGGSADCGGPDPTAGNVDQITVPAGYYDVYSSFVFVS